MSLREKQSEFAKMAAKLILHAFEQGYEVTLGDAFRDPRLHGLMGERMGYGAAKSFHKHRLAIDLNLFKDGVFLDSTEAHRPLGEWWIAQGGTWGGNFSRADGNHYSWQEIY